MTLNSISRVFKVCLKLTVMHMSKCAELPPRNGKFLNANLLTSPSFENYSAREIIMTHTGFE
jgi:hypothetical protein